jgi:hypothetical protein
VVEVGQQHGVTVGAKLGRISPSFLPLSLLLHPFSSPSPTHRPPTATFPVVTSLPIPLSPLAPIIQNGQYAAATGRQAAPLLPPVLSPLARVSVVELPLSPFRPLQPLQARDEEKAPGPNLQVEEGGEGFLGEGSPRAFLPPSGQQPG